MGRVVLLIVLILLINCLCIRSDDTNSTRCIEEERQALLTLKKSFIGGNIQRLWSWQGRDCCDWNGVSCEESTGRVLKLDLRAPILYAPDTDRRGSDMFIFDSLVATEVNPSLMKLKYLKYLDLGGNYFQSRSIPQFLEQMKDLTYLKLSFASFSGIVPCHLGNLSNLEVLDLSVMSKEESSINRYSVAMGSLFIDDFSWVSRLSSLQHLDIGGVNLNYVAPKMMQQVLSHLTSLLHLGFSGCRLNNTHLFTTHPFINSTFLPPTLHYLDLSFNFFYGQIPDYLRNFTSLRVLDLTFNLLNSSVPLWLGNFKNLESLHLAYNELESPNGGIWYILGNLSNLESLDLSTNQFSETIPTSLGRLTSLNSLDLSENQFNGIIPSSLGRLLSLTNLDLSYNKLNGTISTSLGRLSNLRRLDLSNNQLHGIVPESLGKLVNLRRLCLDSNVLEGIVSSEYHLANLSSLESLRMSNNHLIKLHIKPNWIPPFQLYYIGLRSCKFEPRQFPTWLRTQNQLEVLDLSNTSISDTFPLWLLEDKPFLQTLDLSHNLIKGPLPPHLINGTQYLYDVVMTNNMLSGSIPNWFCNLEIEETLDLSKNRFSGHIPNCHTSNLQKLRVIDLSSNKLSGAIPNSFQNMSSLQWLLLSNNNLTGPIPLCLSNVILSVLDLGGNRLSGNIPIWLGESFPSLQILNLRNNMFNGIIPPQLCLLSYLRIMDLADNDLEGTLPTCLGNLTTMTILQSLIAIDWARYEEWNKSNIRQVFKGREMEYASVLKYHY